MCASGSAPVRLQQLYEAGKAAFGSGRKAQPAELEHLRHLMGPCLLPLVALRLLNLSLSFG